MKRGYESISEVKEAKMNRQRLSDPFVSRGTSPTKLNNNKKERERKAVKKTRRHRYSRVGREQWIGGERSHEKDIDPPPSRKEYL